MSNQLQKRYGLLTAMAMVVGIVIGSGVFFKAEKILLETGGNLPLGILAWIIGGVIMVSCAYTFAILATKYEKVNGIVDYAEAAVGELPAFVRIGAGRRLHVLAVRCDGSRVETIEALAANGGGAQVQGDDVAERVAASLQLVGPDRHALALTPNGATARLGSTRWHVVDSVMVVGTGRGPV